jgi:23S rRNA (pseudouridine1915-N3)-methyltransferase
MKVELWMIGKTAFSYLEDGMAIYEKRLKHYLPLSLEVVPDIKNAKNLSPQELKEKEGAIILKKLKNDDLLIILDEKGKEYSSISFSTFIEKQLSAPKKRLIFLIGGAYGFSSEIYQRANMKISLSKMTFSHQMIRLFFLEQLYRAMTILKGEPYHNK